MLGKYVRFGSDFQDEDGTLVVLYRREKEVLMVMVVEFQFCSFGGMG